MMNFQEFSNVFNWKINSTVITECPPVPNNQTLGNIIAFAEANVCKRLIPKLVNLEDLKDKYPGRISTANSMVTLKGPVAVIESIATLNVALPIFGGIVGAFFLNELKRVVVPVPLQTNRLSLVTLILGFGAAATATYVYANPLLPKEPGVFFA